MWVFPGGRIEPADTDPTAPDNLEAAARRAAAREAGEEAALAVDPSTLVWFSHWTPPPITIKRYATWFFAAPAPPGTVVVDGDEATDHVWVRPAEALAKRNALEIELSPPTWITLEQLAPFATTTDVLAALAARPAEYFATRFSVVDDGAVALYAGDAGYETSDASLPGARHRLWMLSSGWRYERD
jgi:8-oxo-dGTP pyrophosphatase MutT (NUDIX family)